MASSSFPVRSVVYSSTATSPFTETDLGALLTASRRNNALGGVTGMLLYREGRFFQVLEGPDLPVREVMERIAADTGHHTVRVLLDELIVRRQFPEWSMGFPRVAGADENVIPGYRATFDDITEDSTDVSPITPAVRALVEWFQNNPR